MLVHDFAATIILFRIAVLYFIAGYWKAVSEVWTNGTAMYYISSIHRFATTSIFERWIHNAYISWTVRYITILIEVALPFVIWSHRALLGKAIVALLEGIHVGIIVFVGLVPFGIIMVGADSSVLNDRDYRRMWRKSRAVTSWMRRRGDRSSVWGKRDVGRDRWFPQRTGCDVLYC